MQAKHIFARVKSIAHTENRLASLFSQRAWKREVEKLNTDISRKFRLEISVAELEGGSILTTGWALVLRNSIIRSDVLKSG